MCAKMMNGRRAILMARITARFRLYWRGIRPDLPKHVEIVLYCKKGMRSLRVLQILSQGYANVKSMRGGFEAYCALLGQAA